MSASAIEEAREQRGGLTFDWSLKKGRPFWLVFFILLSVFGHAAAFYLFQVVYPPQKRELLRPMEVTVLDPRDPLSRHVLSRIDDRVVAFDARATLEIPGEEMPSSTVRFHPFFEGYEPSLRELPPLRTRPSGLFVPGKLYLPAPSGAKVEPVVPPKAAPISPLVHFEWEGEARAVLTPFPWDPAKAPARPDDETGNAVYDALYYLGIDVTGRVAHCLPDQSAGAEMDALIMPAIEAMEFAASPRKRGIEWVWAHVSW